MCFNDHTQSTCWRGGILSATIQRHFFSVISCRRLQHTTFAEPVYLCLGQSIGEDEDLLIGLRRWSCTATVSARPVYCSVFCTVTNSGGVPANIRCWPNAGIMLARRLRRWTSITPALGQHLCCLASILSVFGCGLYGLGIAMHTTLHNQPVSNSV